VRCTESRRALLLAALAAALPVRASNHDDWDAYVLRAAERLVAKNPGRTYDGPVPEPLLAIPVLEIELDATGAVRQIRVLRVPSQATDTVQMAIDAVHRAAPFGDVSTFPRPWVWVEYFLFDDDRRFKPRTLDF
jgi:protein TonB